MSEQAENIAAFKQTIVKLLKDASLDPEHKKLLTEKLFEERNQRREFALKQEQSRAELELKKKQTKASDTLSRKQFWHNTPLVVALVGLITIGANLASSLLLNKDTADNTERLKQIEAQLSEESKSAEAHREASREERGFAYKIIEQELAKSGDQEGRAKVLLFLVRAGILNSLNRDELEKMALNDLDLLGKGQDKVGIPPTVGTRPSRTHDLSLPAISAGQTPAAARMLELAVLEYNLGTNDSHPPERVVEYWKSVSNAEGSQSGDPWGPAFISWLIIESGNPDGMATATTYKDLWDNAQKSGIVFNLSEKSILPGDLIFAENPVSNFFAQKGVKIIMVGVVYGVTGQGIFSIHGGWNNLATRLVQTDLDSSRILGFARLGSSVSGDTPPQ
jgi:hypothetical protein